MVRQFSQWLRKWDAFISSAGGHWTRNVRAYWRMESEDLRGTVGMPWNKTQWRKLPLQCPHCWAVPLQEAPVCIWLLKWGCGHLPDGLTLQGAVCSPCSLNSSQQAHFLSGAQKTLKGQCLKRHFNPLIPIAKSKKTEAQERPFIDFADINVIHLLFWTRGREMFDGRCLSWLHFLSEWVGALMLYIRMQRSIARNRRNISKKWCKKP